MTSATFMRFPPPRLRPTLLLGVAVLLALPSLTPAAETQPKKRLLLPPPPPWKTETVTSGYQNGEQKIAVRVPASYDPKKKYRVLYILPAYNAIPVDALLIFEVNHIADRDDLILATMSFEKTPWFADHATDPKTRQESYVRDFVVPYVEKHYSTLGTKEGRLLIGFSKSGWGAISLILRNPEVFGYAASWDAPYFLDHMKWGLQENLGTDEQFAQYRPDLLVPLHKASFQDKPRLVIGGEWLFGSDDIAPGHDHMKDMHALLDANGVKHVYLPDLRIKHGWHIEWIDPMVQAMLASADGKPASSH